MNTRTAWAVGLIGMALVAVQSFGLGDGQDFRTLYDSARLGASLSMRGHFTGDLSPGGLDVLCIPPFGPVFRAFGLWTLPLGFEGALMLFRIACLGAISLLAWYCRSPLLLIVAPLCPEYVWALKVGNITALQAPLIWLAVSMAGGVAWLRIPKPIPAAILFGGISALKPSLLPVGLIFLFLGWRAVLAMGLAFAVPIALCLVALPGETMAGWWAGLTGLMSNPFTASPANVSIPGLMLRAQGYHFGSEIPAHVASLCNLAAAGILGIGAIAAWAYAASGPATIGAVLACAACLAGPASWYHYPTIMLCALTCVATATPSGIAALVLTVTVMNGDGHLIGTGLAPWPTLGLALLFACWIWIAREESK